MSHYPQNRNKFLYFTIFLILSTSFFCTAQDIKKDILKDWYGDVTQLDLSGNDTLVLKDAYTDDSTKAFFIHCSYTSRRKFLMFFRDKQPGIICGLYSLGRMKWLVRHKKNSYELRITSPAFKYKYYLLPHYDGDILSQIILIRKQ